MISEERATEIASGIEKIRDEKPYDDRGDAIAALDWLSSAGDDLRNELSSTEDIGAIAQLQEQLDVVDRLHSSIVGNLKRTDEGAPRRHSEDPSARVEI